MASQGASIAEEATQVVGAAESDDIVLRLLGGVAVYLRCPSARSGSLSRSYGDTDFMGHARQSAGIKRLFDELGYIPIERFNALNGGRRLAFLDPSRQRRVDVFLDVFEMCHRFDMKDRMEIDSPTLPLADLLATKLQIVQLNRKDIGDAIALLDDHEIGETDDLRDAINGAYLAGLCADDWGTYKTFTTNLAKLKESVEKWDLKEVEGETVVDRIRRLSAAIERVPKSTSWKIRARIGERLRWYELPEEDADMVGPDPGEREPKVASSPARSSRE